MSRCRASVFHFRFYRYVRMMLRRYPKMRAQAFSQRSNSGVRSIVSSSSSGRNHGSHPCNAGSIPAGDTINLSTATDRNSVVHEAESAEQPQAQENDDYDVNDGLNRSSHRDVGVDQIYDQAEHDHHDQDVNNRHEIVLARR